MTKVDERDGRLIKIWIFGLDLSQSGEIKTLIEAFTKHASLSFVESANVSQLENCSNIEWQVLFIDTLHTWMIQKHSDLLRLVSIYLF